MITTTIPMRNGIKITSTKIRRVELRQQETVRLGPAAAAAPPGVRGVTEFWEEDFPTLKS